MKTPDIGQAFIDAAVHVAPYVLACIVFLFGHAYIRNHKLELAVGRALLIGVPFMTMWLWPFLATADRHVFAVPAFLLCYGAVLVAIGIRQGKPVMRAPGND
jgi:hypothetical protein